jgi:hypothetical protein
VSAAEKHISAFTFNGGAARLRRQKRNIARPTLGGRLEIAKKFFGVDALTRPGVARAALRRRNTTQRTHARIRAGPAWPMSGLPCRVG